MTPKRIQRKRVKGWKLPANTICVDRTTRWGNPFKVGDLVDSLTGETLDNAGAVAMFRRAIEKHHPLLGFRTIDLWKLRGKNLACFCGDGEPCHADVLIELANQPTIEKETLYDFKNKETCAS